MSSKSIVHAAEDIFNSMKSGKAIIPPSPVGNADASIPDIRGVSVNENYSNLVLEKSFGIKTEKKAPKVESKKTTPKKNIQDLVEEFAKVVSRAKELIQEMTTCGMIGVGTVKPLGKKKLIKKAAK